MNKDPSLLVVVLLVQDVKWYQHIQYHTRFAERGGSHVVYAGRSLSLFFEVASSEGRFCLRCKVSDENPGQWKISLSHIPSMELWYIYLTWKTHKSKPNVCIGKYAVRPMDGMGMIFQNPPKYIQMRRSLELLKKGLGFGGVSRSPPSHRILTR